MKMYAGKTNEALTNEACDWLASLVLLVFASVAPRGSPRCGVAPDPACRVARHKTVACASDLSPNQSLKLGERKDTLLPCQLTDSTQTRSSMIVGTCICCLGAPASAARRAQHSCLCGTVCVVPLLHKKLYQRLMSSSRVLSFKAPDLTCKPPLRLPVCYCGMLPPMYS